MLLFLEFFSFSFLLLSSIPRLYLLRLISRFSVPFVYVSIFVPGSLCFCYYNFVVLFEVRQYDTFSILLRTGLAIWVFCVSEQILGFFFSTSVKNVIGILKRHI